MENFAQNYITFMEHFCSKGGKSKIFGGSPGGGKRRREEVEGYLHVGVLHEGVEEVGGLHEGEPGVAEGRDGGIHPDANARDGHVHEVSMLVLLVGLVLKSLQQFQENFLGNFAATALQIRKSCQSEVGVQFVSGRVKWPKTRRF